MMHLPPARAVVFDLDGLMFNTEDLYDEVGAILLERRGHRFTRDLKQRMMGRPGRVALQIMIDAHRLNATVAELQAESDTVFQEILPQRLATMPGLEPLLDDLERECIPKGIATSSGRGFVENVLKMFAFEMRFDPVLTAEDVQEGKPHPEIYLTAAANFGLTPAEVLVLEDSQIGCRAAVTAGAITVVVPSVHSNGHDFQDVRLVADSLADPRIRRLLGMAARPR